jgi:hypothetical protein
MREAAEAIRAKSAELLPAGDRRDRCHGDRGLAHAGPGGGRPLRALRPRPPPGAADAAAPPVGPGHPAGPGRDHRRHDQPPAGRRGGLHHLLQLPHGQHGRQGGPALAAGNTVVVKPAPQDPLAVWSWCASSTRSASPRGGQPGQRQRAGLLGRPGRLRRRRLRELHRLDPGGRHHRREGGPDHEALLLELGGKGACVVFDDADVKAAIGCIGSTWSFHSGQICTAPTRAVVHRSLFDQVRDGLVQMAGYLKVGDPTDKATIIGPVISAAQRGRIEAHIATAVEDGGEVVIGGERPADLPKGFYVAPTLITGDNTMRVAREEIFGPVITLIPFDDEDEGIAIANDTEFGLYDYVFSKDGARALRAAKQLQAGHVGINTAQRNHDAPFGGFKMSGVGRDGGDFGLLAYSEPQAIIWTSTTGQPDVRLCFPSRRTLLPLTLRRL